MKSPQDRFEEYLVANEGRYTQQKKTIADLVFATKGHFEIESFIDDLRANHQKISRATVYRTVKQLLDANLVQKISTRDGKVFYEKNTRQKQHDHLICNTCGSIFEIKENTIEDYLNQYCHKLGFQSEYRSLHIYGTCRSCARSR